MILDPSLPTGPVRELTGRPSTREAPACSVRRPVCVQRCAGASTQTALDLLASLESAYERVVLALDLPAPLPDQGAGGSDALDFYLSGAGQSLRVLGGGTELSNWHQSSAFCAAPQASPAELERWATLCVAEAVALRLSAAETPHLRRAFASELRWITELPNALDIEAVRAAQEHPELGVLDSEGAPLAEGAALFFDYLETLRSSAGPGVLSASLLAAGVSRAETPAWLMRNEPDALDVLWHSLGKELPQWAALFQDFAVERALLGAAAATSNLTHLHWAGAFGSLRADWQLTLSSLPRHVRIVRPLLPTGSALIRLKVDAPFEHSVLGFRAEWEAPVPFIWQLVSLDAAGRVLARFAVPFQERAHSVEARLIPVQGVHEVWVLGTNLGQIELETALDPDHAPFEAHAATVYLVKL